MKPFWIALSTLTLLPSPVKNWTPKDLRTSLVFYPFIGAAVGFLLFLNHFWPVSVSVQALFALLTWVLLTRSFHLDGLADCLDGWLGGRTPAQKFKIMKDPATGTYGTVGVFLLLLSKYVFLQLLFLKSDSWLWFLLIPMIARWSVGLACFHHPPRSKYKGLASAMFGFPLPLFALSCLFLIPGFFRLPWTYLAMLVFVIGFNFFWSFLSRRQIGDLTGDGLGALIELTETGLLMLLGLGLFN
jgi:adenosylcobinamide-GDP ribazoletransferase